MNAGCEFIGLINDPDESVKLTAYIYIKIQFFVICTHVIPPVTCNIRDPSNGLLVIIISVYDISMSIYGNTYSKYNFSADKYICEIQLLR